MDFNELSLGPRTVGSPHARWTLRPAAPRPLLHLSNQSGTERSAEPLALDKTLPWHVGYLDHPQLIESAC
jgi:hypothetical protein